MIKRSTLEWCICGCLALCLLASTSPARANLLVSNYTKGSVEEYTLSGSFVRTFVPSGSGGLVGPANLRFGPSGDLYVAGTGGIKIYDGATGAYLRDFAGASVLDFVFDPTGGVYAVDGVQVLKFAASGSLLGTYTNGVSTPEGIVVGKQGKLLVVNSYAGAYRNSVTELDPADGSFTTFATGLGTPIGIAGGSDGRYYIANYSTANNFGGINPDTIQVVAPSGGVSTTWNQGGTLKGANYLVFSGDRLYVSSFANASVQIFDAANGDSLGSFLIAGGMPFGIAVTPLPEPSTWVLWAVGVCFVLRFSLRRVSRNNN